MNKFLPLLFTTFVIHSCSLHSDYTTELSGGYFLRSEGGINRDILHHDSGFGEIPANILSYDFNNEFIVARQRPAKFSEPLYEGRYEYPKGKDKIYFWLVINKQHRIFGPLSEQEFEVMCEKYNVPCSLDVNNESQNDYLHSIHSCGVTNCLTTLLKME